MQRHHLTRFILTGLATTAVHYLALSACVNVLAIDPVAATFPAFALAFLLGYTLNRNWTFGSNAQHRRAFPAYFGLALVGLANNALLMQLLVNEMQQSYTTGFLAGVLTTPVISYLGSRHLVFNSTKLNPIPKK